MWRIAVAGSADVLVGSFKLHCRRGRRRSHTTQNSHPRSFQYERNGNIICAGSIGLPPSPFRKGGPRGIWNCGITPSPENPPWPPFYKVGNVRSSLLFCMTAAKVKPWWARRHSREFSTLNYGNLNSELPEFPLCWPTNSGEAHVHL